jgi:hypothetical protein
MGLLVTPSGLRLHLMPGLLEWGDPAIEAGGLHQPAELVLQPREGGNRHPGRSTDWRYRRRY